MLVLIRCGINEKVAPATSFIFSKRVSELCTDFYTTTEFTDQFKRLNAVLKEFEVKDHIERSFLNIKMIDLNRKTLPLYRRLDEKNRIKKQA